MIRRLLGTKEVIADPGPPYRTEAQMTEHCCDQTKALQCQEKVIGDIQPDMDKALKNLGLTLDAQGRDQNGRLVRIAWKARNNPCGKVVQRYNMTAKNCCDEVTALAVDTSASATVIAPGTFGFITITGGRLPFFIRLRGNGFSIDGYSLRDAWSYSRTFRVYAHEMACGHAPITIDDGCSILQTGVRASVGEWVLVLNNNSWPLDYCPFRGNHPADQVYVAPYVWGWDAYSADGRYKLHQETVGSYTDRLSDCIDQTTQYHYSCVNNFWAIWEGILEIYNDRCARYDNPYHGYYRAQHTKNLYEWRC